MDVNSVWEDSDSRSCEFDFASQTLSSSGGGDVDVISLGTGDGHIVGDSLFGHVCTGIVSLESAFD